MDAWYDEQDEKYEKEFDRKAEKCQLEESYAQLTT